MTTQSRQDAYSVGYRMGLKGMHGNPFSLFDSRATYWRRGYDDAMRFVVNAQLRD